MRLKKQNVAILLVVVIMLAIALTIVMVTTKNEAQAYMHTCAICSGTKRCPGTPELKASQTGTALCPGCNESVANWKLWECDTCGYAREIITCLSCGYDDSDGETDLHSSQPCPNCDTGECGGTIICEYAGNGRHHETCRQCGFVNSVACSDIEILEIDDTYHGEFCMECAGRISEEEHEDIDNDGYCDACSYQMTIPHTHTPKTTWERDAYEHWKICSDSTCGEVIVGTIESHRGGTHPDGECTVCGYQYQTHILGSTPTSYTDKTSTTHTPVYTCSCGTTENGTAESHVDSNSDGICDSCSYQMTIPHTHTPKTTWEKDANSHWKICSDSTCGEVIVDTIESHSGGTHPDGECTVCGYQYQTHTLGSTPTSYTDKTSTTHTPVYTCSCGATENGTAESHVDSNSDGICDKCLYQMHIHTPKVTWEKDANNHWKICSDLTCGEEIEGTLAAHSGATHENGGKCTVCEYQYQIHILGSTPTSYTDKTSTTHTPVYTCSCGTTENGTAESHVDSNSDGKCDKCAYSMTVPHTHTPKSTWEADADKHWKICSDATCGEKIAETEASHTIANWTNKNDGTHSGKCSICEYTITKSHNYENGTCADCGALENAEETCDHDWQLKYNETQHWQECTKCGEKKNIENHSYNNGICGCGKEQEVAECKHENKEWKSNQSEHWQVCKNCGEEIEGTRKTHSFIDGKCECGATKQTTECEHKDREWKCNETEHWQVCKDCGEEIEGTRSKHNYTDGACKNCGLKDSSSSQNKIPNTGVKGVVIISIVAFAVLSTIGAIKLKKYKNI